MVGGAGRCGSCGVVVPLPGEELVGAVPLAAEVPLDRRGDRAEGARSSVPRVGVAVALDRRETPRGPPPAMVLATEEPEIEIDLDLEVAAIDDDGQPAPTAGTLRLLVAFAVDGLLLAGLPLAALGAATGAGPATLPRLAATHPSLLVASVALAGVTAFVYLTLSCALGGRTLGDRVAGLRAVAVRSGEAPSLGRAALRALAAVIGAFACLAGPLWALFDTRGQGLHDKLAGTVLLVVR